MLPSRNVLSRPFRVPVSSYRIVVSVGSTTNLVATLPQGTSGIVPTQVPAKRVCFAADCLTEAVAEVLASDLAYVIVAESLLDRDSAKLQTD